LALSAVPELVGDLHGVQALGQESEHVDLAVRQLDRQQPDGRFVLLHGAHPVQQHVHQRRRHNRSHLVRLDCRRDDLGEAGERPYQEARQTVVDRERQLLLRNVVRDKHDPDPAPGALAGTAHRGKGLAADRRREHDQNIGLG
jgi:hypothetical protein